VGGGSPPFETRRIVRVVPLPGPEDREVRHQVDLLDANWTSEAACARVITRFRRVGE